MGAGHAQTNAIGEEEDARAGVIKLPAIVTLKALHTGVKLCAHIGKEIRQGGEGIRLKAEREGP